MIALSVPEISALDGFCDEQHKDEDEEELGILVVGLFSGEHVSSIPVFICFSSLIGPSLLTQKSGSRGFRENDSMFVQNKILISHSQNEPKFAMFLWIV